MKSRNARLLLVAAVPVVLLAALIGFKVAVVENEPLREDVLEQICSGGTTSVYLAKLLFSGHAHFNEELASALSASLQVSPEPVLASYGAAFCFPPDHLPHNCNVANWKAASLQALTRISDERLASSVLACRTAIEQG